MDNRALLLALMGLDDRNSFTDNLLQTPFDDMYEADLGTGRYHSVYRAEGKYAMPVQEGSLEHLIAYASAELVHPEDRERFESLMELSDLTERMAAARYPGVLWAEIRLKTFSGAYVRTRHLLTLGKACGLPERILRCYIYDIQMQSSRVAVWDLKNARQLPGVRYDPLTGLLVEKDFFAMAQEQMGALEGKWCLVAVDIEHYKLFSDWFGVEQGRKLLSQVARELKTEAVEQNGLAGYRGADLFSLMVPYDRPRIEALYERLRQVIRSLGPAEGFEPVFGICLIDDPTASILELYNHAAITTEEIVDRRLDHIQVYDSEQHRRNSMEYQLLRDFHQAMENGNISFWLQPQCSVDSHLIVGAESLARWRKPDGTWVPPAVFVPILEKFGVVTKLDRFIWESVCRWLRNWMDQGRQPVPISVNISRIDVIKLDVPSCFMELLDRYALPRNAIKLEITESAYVEDSNAVRQTVARLRELGFMVLMDDFGSGYSSLNMLRNLSVDVIKLDAQLLPMKEGEWEERKAISILESIVAMTKNLSTPVIVEGVETKEQEQFLTELGCGYIQGFYLHRPMPTAQFEKLISDEQRVDRQGFVFKANQQFRVREFLDENIYSDAMLNSIIGPVAFYRLREGKSIDIIRYNEQFFELVGISLQDFNRRITDIQQFFYPGDAEKMLQLMELAERDHLNGSRGIVRVYRPNGVLVWVSVQLYFMGEDEQGKTYYGSNQDVTELQFISADLPGSYFRCTNDENFTFLFLSQSFLELTGYTAGEIRALYDDRLSRMVHPDDLARLLMDTVEYKDGRRSKLSPYRIRRKGGDYIYVAEQCRLTESFGALCWQSVVIDVTETMVARRHMRLLSGHFQGAILFLHRQNGELVYEAVVHGLEEQLGLDDLSLEKALNSGEFCQWVDGFRDLPHEEYTEQFVKSALDRPRTLTVRLPNGRTGTFTAKADRVHETRGDVEYIVTLREVSVGVHGEKREK